MAASSTVGRNVQHLTKASSDELLRKFAEEEPGEKVPIKKNHTLLRVSLARRKRKSSRRTLSRPTFHGDHLRAERMSEWKGLLPKSPLPRRTSILTSGISEKIKTSDFFLHAMEKVSHSCLTSSRSIIGITSSFFSGANRNFSADLAENDRGSRKDGCRGALQPTRPAHWRRCLEISASENYFSP